MMAVSNPNRNNKRWFPPVWSIHEVHQIHAWSRVLTRQFLIITVTPVAFARWSDPTSQMSPQYRMETIPSFVKHPNAFGRTPVTLDYVVGEQGKMLSLWTETENEGRKLRW
jgi:hypothetical protein